MSYLLDTNVISEIIRKFPNPSVMRWLKDVDNSDIYISVLTLGEIRKGVEKIEEIDKRQKILLWLEQDLRQWFKHRIIFIDETVADQWGFLMAQCTFSIPVIDSLIAATALTRNLKLVTRNVKDFQFADLEVLNPFS